jgi:hypothetical protein
MEPFRLSVGRKAMKTVALEFIKKEIGEGPEWKSRRGWAEWGYYK